MPIAYIKERVALLHTIDYSNSHIKIVNLQLQIGEMFNPDALILFNVSHNEISHLNATSLFVKADDLLTIDLSYNRIDSLSRMVFNRFGKLQVLNLSFNDIEQLHENIFSDLHDLKILKINNNNLTTLRNLFEKTHSLQHLDLSFNNIESTETTTFYQTKKLQSLKLNNNKISVVPDLQHLAVLTILDLSNNAITSLDSSIFSKIPLLQELRLTNNKLREFNTLQFLEHIPNLSDLYVNQNRLTEIYLINALKLRTLHAAENNITSAHLMAMGSLEVLDLSRNNLSDLVIIGLVALRKFKVDHNNLTSIEKVCSALPAKLSTLDMAYNQLNDIDSKTFGRFKDLQLLNLQHSGLNHIDANTFSGITNVRTLDISQNKLRDFDLKYLRNQKELTALFLDGNGLRSLEKMNFSSVNLPKLKRIGISHNDWSCTSLPQLLEQIILKGIKVLVDRPPEGQHISFIGCVVVENRSTLDTELDHMVTSEFILADDFFPTNQNHYENSNKQFLGKIDDYLPIKENNQHTEFPTEVVLIWLLSIIFWSLLIGIAIFCKRNRSTNHSPTYIYTQSALHEVS